MIKCPILQSALKFILIKRSVYLLLKCLFTRIPRIYIEGLYFNLSCFSPYKAYSVQVMLDGQPRTISIPARVASPQTTMSRGAVADTGGATQHGAQLIQLVNNSIFLSLSLSLLIVGFVHAFFIRP